MSLTTRTNNPYKINREIIDETPELVNNGNKKMY
jgi:hypothetical protein